MWRIKGAMPLKLSSRSLAASKQSINEGFISLHCWTGSSLRTGAWASKVVGRGLKRLKQKLIWLDLFHFHFLVYSPYFFFFFSKIVNHVFPWFKSMYHWSLVEVCNSLFFLFVLEIFISLILFLRISIPFSPPFPSFPPWENCSPLSYWGSGESVNLLSPPLHPYPPQPTYLQNHHLTLMSLVF